ncbi:MAG: DUF4143 domain-containing protein [Myxococcota bacterium]
MPNKVNFSSIASDAEVPARTVREYFQLLEDTLVGELLPAFRKTTRRKAMTSAKFYFFDVGVAHALLHRASALAATTGALAGRWSTLSTVSCAPGSVIAPPQHDFPTGAPHSRLQVDFVLEFPDGRTAAVEVKATRNVSRRDLRGLRALAEDIKNLKKIVVADEPAFRTTEDNIHIRPVDQFLDYLWQYQDRLFD